MVQFIDRETNGSFNHWASSIMRLQNLGGNWSLYAQLHGQIASKNLDSSEKFSIGGAYPQSEASGDQGWMANVEVRYDLSLTDANIGIRWNYKALNINATLAAPIGSEDSIIDESDVLLFVKVVFSF